MADASAVPDEQADVIELLWGERARPTRGRKPTLTLQAIARTGIAIADADGLASATMQRVGEALGVTKMALYRHVPGKTALVALMIDTGLGEPPPLDSVPGGWRPKLDRWARALFACYARHPWAIETTVGNRIMGPNELGWLEQALAALADTGLAGGEMLDLAATLVWHVRASAQQAAVTPSDSPEQAMAATITAVLRGREGQFPSVLAAFDSAAAHAVQDQALEFGLSRILDGVQLLISGRA